MNMPLSSFVRLWFRPRLAYAEYNLTQTAVFAPSDGYITNLQLVNGAYIGVGDAVLTFVDDESWWVVANFREK